LSELQLLVAAGTKELFWIK